MRAAPLLALLVLAACGDKPSEDSGGGDTISYESLESGSYTVTAPDGLVTLTLDTSASTYALSLDGGEPSTGTLTVLATEDWTICCYLNGSGHSKFETVSLSEPITMGGLDLQAPHISADGPTLFDGDDGIPTEAYEAAEAHTMEGPQ